MLTCSVAFLGWSQLARELRDIAAIVASAYRTTREYPCNPLEPHQQNIDWGSAPARDLTHLGGASYSSLRDGNRMTTCATHD